MSPNVGTGAEPNRAKGVYQQVRHVNIKEIAMKGVAAYFLVIPIVVIILLYVTGIF